MKKAKSSKTVIMAAFSANLLIALVKFVVAWLSASSAMLAEAVHSTADTLNQVLLFVGIKKAAKKADELHPFGFSGEAYFWSFIVAIILFTSGAIFSIYEGVQKLRHPAPVDHVAVALLVLVIAMIAEGVSLRVAFKKINVERGKTGLIAYLRQIQKSGTDRGFPRGHRRAHRPDHRPGRPAARAFHRHSFFRRPGLGPDRRAAGRHGPVHGQ